MLNPIEILDKIERLRNLDLRRKIFGARSHNYRLNSCLNEETIKLVEDRHRIHLPEEYRRFLMEVGNGGAGPYYGLFKLGEQDNGMGFVSWEDGYLLGDPAIPFGYEDKWNLPDTFWSEGPYNKEWANEEEADSAHEAWDARMEELYWALSVMNGAIPICHCGCALRQWLVVTGSERGNVWGDDRADCQGVYPLIGHAGKHKTFSEWYTSWLDEAIGLLEEE